MYNARLGWLLVLSAASACYSGRTAKEDADEPVTPAKDKTPSTIVPQSGERLSLFGSPLGDMDGDGLDEILIQGVSTEASSPNAPSALYLFYGKSEFAPQLSTADADAVFETTMPNGGPIGDVNCDGLADLQLTHEGSAEFVFGSSKRLLGNFAGKAIGTVWHSGELPPPAASGLTTQIWVRPANDVDGDGCDDVLVNATVISEESGFGTRGYLVRGRRGDWESAVWDPSWAVARFGAGPIGMGETERFADIWPEAAGDLDDDGCADLLAPAGEQSWLFYGRREFRAEISATDADAQLKHPVVQQAWDWQSGTFSSMISGLSSDIDRDGMDDLVVTSDSPDSVGFVYGRRWSGELALERDFTIEVEQPGRQYIAGVGTADLDGDHQPEILLSISTLGLQGSEGVYVVQGEGKRLRGSRRLLATERWIVPESGRTLTGGETFLFNVGVSGDVDGDGGQEILTHLQNDAEGFPMPVHLMPSTRRSSK